MEAYWRQRLDPRGRAAYDAMCAAAERGTDTARIDLEGARATACFEALLSDRPDLWNLSPELRVQVRSNGLFGGRETFVRLTPLRRGADAARTDRAMQAARSVVDPAASAVENERAVCRFVVSNVVYRIDIVHNQNAAAALVDHAAQCSGIARAVKYLLDACGVWCIVATGTARDGKGGTGPHAWNVVRIDGNYYHLDPTFLLGANPGGKEPINYAFFNVDDATLSATHTWDRSTLPPCTDRRFLRENGAPARGEPAAPPAGVDAVSSLYEIKQLFPARARSATVRFFYRTDLPVEKQSELIKGLVDAYLREQRVSASYRFGCTGGVWTLELKVGGNG